MNTITYEQITEKDISKYKDLIIPMVYEELLLQENIEENYLALAATDGDTALGALVAEWEEDGDITLLSIWTSKDHRRDGVASGLIKKMTEVALALYDWEGGQYGDDITIKTMYCLEDQYREVFEAWLEKNDFTDYIILREGTAERPEICGATAEVHFFRTR
ncbi:MAG: GNAT family N-acetyltransferase [Butyrivibrio sp.]|nr:GNAT family N-acetyltransferase [Butyrivibrio sp.]